jgi:hypothetical protein
MLQCNKGQVNKDCSQCECPDFYDGDSCLSQYISLTVAINGNTGMSQYYYLAEDIRTDLADIYNFGVTMQIDVDTTQIPFMMTIKFIDQTGSTSGDYGARLTARDMLVKDFMDPSSQIYDYYFASFIQGNTVKVQDPPKETPPRGAAMGTYSSSTLTVMVLALLSLVALL